MPDLQSPKKPLQDDQLSHTGDASFNALILCLESKHKTSCPFCEALYTAKSWKFLLAVLAKVKDNDFHGSDVNVSEDGVVIF